MSETLFKPETTGEPPVTPPSTTGVPPELVEFVGTGKKYASLEDALKSVPHAQKHIATLEQEVAAVKVELEKRQTIAEIFEEIKRTGLPTAATQTAANSGLTPEEITNLISQTLTKNQEQANRKVNEQKVTTAFTEKFGAKAEEVFINLAKEAGLPISYLNDMAATSPTAVLKLAGIETKPSTVQRPTGTVNIASLDNNQQDVVSARVKNGSTQALKDAWKNAGKKVGKE
jgi:hypothetical protein